VREERRPCPEWLVVHLFQERMQATIDQRKDQESTAAESVGLEPRARIQTGTQKLREPAQEDEGGGRKEENGRDRATWGATANEGPKTRSEVLSCECEDSEVVAADRRPRASERNPSEPHGQVRKEEARPEPTALGSARPDPTLESARTIQSTSDE
jgi:hypothetical protein